MLDDVLDDEETQNTFHLFWHIIIYQSWKKMYQSWRMLPGVVPKNECKTVERPITKYKQEEECYTKYEEKCTIVEQDVDNGTSVLRDIRSQNVHIQFCLWPNIV